MTFTPSRPTFAPAQGPATPGGRPWDPSQDPYATTQVRPINPPMPPATPPMQPVISRFVQNPQQFGPAPVGLAHQPAMAPYPLPAAPRGSNRTWPWIGAGMAVVAGIAVAAGVLIAVGGSDKTSSAAAINAGEAPGTESTSTPSSGPPPVAALVSVDALPGLLLDQSSINSIEGATGMRADPGNPALPYKGAQVDHPECAGIWHPAELPTLQGTGWIALQGNSFHEPVPEWRHAATQTVVSFPSAEAATNFANNQATSWANCGGKSLTERVQGKAPNFWSVGSTEKRDGTVTVQLVQQGTGGWGCQRALMARNNVVIDVRSCGFNPADEAISIAKKIADRMPANQ